MQIYPNVAYTQANCMKQLWTLVVPLNLVTIPQNLLRAPVVFANLLQPLILKYWKIEANSDVKADKNPHGRNIQMCYPAKM